MLSCLHGRLTYVFIAFIQVKAAAALWVKNGGQEVVIFRQTAGKFPTEETWMLKTSVLPLNSRGGATRGTGAKCQAAANQRPLERLSTTLPSHTYKNRIGRKTDCSRN